VTTPPRASIDPPTERVWLEQFLGWLNPAILGLAILDALLFVATSSRPLLPVAVLIAGDSRTGLETFRVHIGAISCVLLDLTLPQINGEQVFHAISSLKPGTPIVLMSGYGEDRANNHFDGYNVVGFLRKPFARDALAEKIWQAVGDTSSVEV
jgi:CheY-like chemotaxis protein